MSDPIMYDEKDVMRIVEENTRLKILLDKVENPNLGPSTAPLGDSWEERFSDTERESAGWQARWKSAFVRAEKAEAELVKINIGGCDAHTDFRSEDLWCPVCLMKERDRLREALEPFVEIWKKRAGPGQPSISSGMGVASPVKYYINAEDALAGVSVREMW